MIILRCDDFDPRINVETLKPLHEEFIKRGIPMTVSVNSAMSSRIGFDKEVIDYVNNTDPKTWDIQLHCWSHDRYWAMTYIDLYAYIYANLMKTKQDFIHANPTILYPPWNESNDIMENVCRVLGLKIVNFRRTLREFVTWNFQNKEMEEGYVWHWWTKDDRDIIPQALDKLLVNQQ